MQSMARSFSEFLEINIKNHNSKEKYQHYINVDKNSLLYRILGDDKLLVNSRHKSAIIETKLDVVARSDDNVIEAVEDKSKTFFLGVEWHPESLDDIYSKRIFDYFIYKINL